MGLNSSERRQFLTSRLRERWYASDPITVDISQSLPVQRLPLHIIRQRLRQRSEKEAGVGACWQSEEELRRKEMYRRDFQHKWIHEVLKKDQGYHQRLPYVRDMAPLSVSPKQRTWFSNTDTKAFFYNSCPQRPQSDYEKERRSRHFVHPEWNSETISWARLYSGVGARPMHKINLF